MRSLKIAAGCSGLLLLTFVAGFVLLDEHFSDGRAVRQLSLAWRVHHLTDGEARVASSLRRIGNSVKIHRSRTGHVPSDLGALHAIGLVDSEVVSRLASGYRIEYRSAPDSSSEGWIAFATPAATGGLHFVVGDQPGAVRAGVEPLVDAHGRTLAVSEAVFGEFSYKPYAIPVLAVLLLVFAFAGRDSGASHGGRASPDPCVSTSGAV